VTDEADPAQHPAAVLSTDQQGPDGYVSQCPAQAFDRVYGGNSPRRRDCSSRAPDLFPRDVTVGSWLARQA
jgi:hypothetical protein